MPTAQASSQAAASSRNPPPNHQAILVLHVDVLLLSVLGVFFLATLPRAFGRLSNFSQWTEGVWFRSVYLKDVKPRGSSPSRNSANVPVDEKSEKITSVRITEATDSFPDPTYASSSLSDGGDLKDSPKHILALTSIFPGISWLLSLTIRPGYTVGRLLLMLAYFGVMLYAGLYRSNPFTNPPRAGLVAASQIPLVLVLATKNNVVGALVGMGYEKLNYLHRFVGRFIIFAINTHAIGFMYNWTIHGTWKEDIVHPLVQWGLVGLVCMDILFLFSISVFRQMFYHVFYVTHVVAGVVMMAAVCKHVPETWPYALTGAGLYGLDRLLRIISMRIVPAHLNAIPELHMVRIDIPKINAGWRAGQHLRIKVLSTGMGLWGWSEPHPFTIANVSKSEGEEGLVLMCKKAGDWTSKLYELAQSGAAGEAGAGRNVHVAIDGPYGGPGYAVISSYSGAMVVAGGSGITYALATVEELLQKGAEGASRVKVIELIWSVQHPSSLHPLLPLFSLMLVRAESASVSLRISIFYTRATRSEDELKPYQILPLSLTLSPGRPRLSALLDGVVERTSSKTPNGQKPSGVLVGVCGPVALGEEAGKTVRAFPRDKFKAVGGIELHEESFGW